LPLVCF